VKHLANAAFWICVFGWLCLSEWLSHVEKLECIERGGSWEIEGGCDPNHCEVKR
jgi:hypothetical protein